jgi:hypothetical protein
MVDKADSGDKQIIKKHESTQNSDLNFLTVGDSSSPEAIAQKEINNRIAKVQDSIMAKVEKLAAYYPNGYQGVLDSMVKGPAHDHLASALKPGPTTFS